jgi:hypothetical protein
MKERKIILMLVCSISIAMQFFINNNCLASSSISSSQSTSNQEESANDYAEINQDDVSIDDSVYADDDEALSEDEATDNVDNVNGSPIVDAQALKENALRVSNDQNIVSQVISITNEQKNIQDSIEVALQKTERHTGVFLKIFGPDFATIKKIKDNLLLKEEKNKEIEQLLPGVKSDEVKGMLNKILSDIKRNDDKYQQDISKRENISSLFGWFVRLFYK